MNMLFLTIMSNVFNVVLSFAPEMFNVCYARMSTEVTV